jgi:long-subunit acyl-CoA synthetase (AMP-forming)
LVVLAEDLRPKVSQASVRAEVEQEMANLLAHVNAHSAEYEQLKMLVLSTEPWTIENGCLTPTMKIKRSRIEFNVQHQIDNWYTHGKNVIWA